MFIRIFGAAVIAVSSFQMAASAPVALAGDTCPNAMLRVGPSAALPDCRAYELVTPDLNHASLGSQPAGQSSADGQMLLYQTIDAPDRANSASVTNLIRARRDAAEGWAGASLSLPLPAPVTAFTSITPMGVSGDLSATVEGTDQPLTSDAPVGKNYFVGRSDGTYRLMTPVGTPLGFTQSYPTGAVSGGTPDYSHVYFQPPVAQVSSDPLAASYPFALNTYVWSEDKGTRLIGILPDGTPAPNGATFAGASNDGRYVVFLADNRLYLRIDDSSTEEIGVSQRTVDPDLNPAPTPRPWGILADGSKVLFSSKSELTNDANTGRSGGAATDAGNDLYSYDTATGLLTDLTVDTEPTDAATGADVQLEGVRPFVRATADGSHIYFVARGVLADGARPGHASLYVLHDGRIDFVANADGIDRSGGGSLFYITPNGRHAAFASTDSLTGYDNTDPMTGQPHSEVFKATVGAGVACASCRADGTRPTGDSNVPTYGGISTAGNIRVMSADGRRVFFHSTDAVMPQAISGRQMVFEYADGKVAPISRVDDPSSAIFLDASASGDDVFFTSYDDPVAGPNAGDQMVFDARVGGGIPVFSRDRCSGAACHAAPPAPALSIAASVAFLGGGDGEDVNADTGASPKVSVSKVKIVTGTAGSLKVKVPGKGRLTVSGSGLQTKRSSPSKAQTLTVRLALTTAAAKTLRKKRSYKTKVRVTFADSGGHTSAATLSVSFKLSATRKGHSS